MEKYRAAEKLLTSDHTALDHEFDAAMLAIDKKDAVQSFVRLDYFWARVGIHIRAEHLCLFPAILDALTQTNASQRATIDLVTVRDTIGKLRDDHNFFMIELARATNILRTINVTDDENSNGWQDIVRKIIVAVRHRLEEHNHVEEEKVYRWASMLLIGSNQDRLASSVRNELENLPPRFKAK